MTAGAPSHAVRSPFFLYGGGMSPVALVALKKLVYAGQCYVAGESFDARDESDAYVLKITRLADDAPASSQAKAMEPEPEPVVPQREPEPSPESESEPDDEPEQDESSAEAAPVLTKRTYRRRDMTAERE